MVYFQKQPGSQQNTQPRYAPRITSVFLCRSGVLTRLCGFDVWKKKYIYICQIQCSKGVWNEASRDRRCERSCKQIRDIVPFRFRPQRRQQASVSGWQMSFSVNNKACEHNLKSSSITSSNTKLISYRKVSLQITDFHEPTSVHPVGSKSDWFPPLGGIKYAVFFLWERHF